MSIVMSLRESFGVKPVAAGKKNKAEKTLVLITIIIMPCSKSEFQNIINVWKGEKKKNNPPKEVYIKYFWHKPAKTKQGRVKTYTPSQ